MQSCSKLLISMHRTPLNSWRRKKNSKTQIQPPLFIPSIHPITSPLVHFLAYFNIDIPCKCQTICTQPKQNSSEKEITVALRASACITLLLGMHHKWLFLRIGLDIALRVVVRMCSCLFVCVLFAFWFDVLRKWIDEFGANSGKGSCLLFFLYECETPSWV